MRAEQERERYRTVAFRMSDEEVRELDKRVELSGRMKQDYLILSSLYQELNIVGNRILFQRLESLLSKIALELERIDNATEVTTETLMPLRTTVEIIRGFRVDGTYDQKHNDIFITPMAIIRYSPSGTRSPKASKSPQAQTLR